MFDIRYSAKKVLCTLFSLAVFVQPSFAQTTFARGDVNGDGRVDIADALLIQQVVDGKRDILPLSARLPLKESPSSSKCL